MEFDEQIELEHLLFSERKCRVCGKVKNLVEDFYLTRKYKVDDQVLNEIADLFHIFARASAIDSYKV